MKILILHQHFNTPQGGGAIRSYYLAKALAGKGIQTVVITAHNEAGYKTEIIEGIEVHYLPVAYDNRFKFYRRILSFYRFVVKAIRTAAHHGDADVCYAISTPLTTGLAAYWIKRKYQIPYVFEVGDLWPSAPIEMGFIKNRFAKRILYRLERSIYSSADSIVGLSRPIRDAIRKKAPEKSVHVIPNMADTNFFKPEEKQFALEKKFGVRNKFVVSYIGALGVANGLHHVLDCAAASQRNGLAVHFLLCGDGAMLNELQRRAYASALNNLTILPFQNRDGIRDIMNVTDANLVSYLPVKILETGSPNKYFDGLAAGKLTIINFGGWIRDEIEKEKCGVYVSAEHPDDFVEKVRPFLVDKDLLKSCQLAARALAERKYSRTDLTERYCKVLLER